tara:strand:- start:202 stop:486 length:285 start_codon:yes stop_codon:yes gene_type:complete
MALTKSTEDDKIEIVGEYKHIQIRTATVIKEDGVELSRKFSRRVLRSGTLDASDNFVDTDISSESAEIQSICNGVWSTTAKDAWKAKMIASKAS